MMPPTGYGPPVAAVGAPRRKVSPPRRLAAAAWVGSMLACGAALGVGAAPAQAQTATIADVRVEREGQAVRDPFLLSLIETTVGEPVSAREVRDTVAHLMGTNAFDDVQVFQQPSGAGVGIRYVLVPAHPVDRVAFQGSVGVPENELRRVVLDQFGAVPRAAQMENARQAVVRALRDRGFPSASVVPRVVESHDPDRATMLFVVDAGARAVIVDLRVAVTDEQPLPQTPEQPDIVRGRPYEKASVDRALQRWVDRMRARGHYEARASHGALFSPDGVVVSVTLTLGPMIHVAFAGDPLTEADRERLVPIRSEASADEDLLEDSARAIEAFLKEQGYRDARADYEPVSTAGSVTVTFTVNRGPQYVVRKVDVAGNASVSTPEVRTWLRVAEGDLFSEERLAQGLAAVRGGYRGRGHVAVQVQARQVVVAPERGTDPSRQLDVVVTLVEGPRTVVGMVSFEGQRVLSAESLLVLTGLVSGRPYTEVDVVTARDRIEIEYRNRGHDQIAVRSDVTLVDADARADVRFTVTEGPQVLVDRVLIVGAERTNPDLVRRELLLRPGQPLGYAATVDSRARVQALGLFRRVTIEEIPHGAEPRRDVLVRLEELPPTTIGGGGGVEGAFRLRTDDAGQAVERFELVPRGFFEVGRRNLWGKNRAANLFTRVSVRNRDVGVGDTGLPASSSTAAGYGFNEYRVVGTFREPRVFGTAADVLVTGILEQAIRSSFNFARRELRAEAGLRMSRVYSLTGRYSFERTELFDERFTLTESTLIDRLFPQVRLSTFSGSFIRDTRDDPVDASSGGLLTVTGDLAARAIGSEVGFSKSYVEAFSFLRLPTARRAVLALGVRLGAANGFPREVPRMDADGRAVVATGGDSVAEVVDTIPVSKRFFAGGDTTVRGFSLDRLGDDKTISASGFPTGGNGVLVLNGEMRIGVAGPLQAVGFLDAGNVVARASELRVADLRTAAGFGIRYRSPVGPIRLDLGFKLDRRELAPGRLERRSVWHISFGQAF